ncbi:MAG: sulfatase [Desulfocucumaceae bacterium]
MKVRYTAAIIVILALASGGIFFSGLPRLFERPADKPNILLITVCSLRQDHLGCYGYRRDTSPNIDALADISNVFNNCHTNIPWTKPSVIALMTGRYPHPDISTDNRPTLAGSLHSAGYLNLAVVGTEVAREGAKAGAGFDVFMDNTSLKTGKDAMSVQADTLVNAAEKLLENSQKEKQPVFLWLFFKDPHWPYLPPSGYRGIFLNDTLYKQEKQDLPINGHFYNSTGGIGEARLSREGGGFFTDKAYYISQYDAEIRYLDAEIGRFISYLRGKGNYEDWLIVLISDHGESLGEDNYFFDHGYTLSEAAIRIPLIIKLPRQRKKRVVDCNVSIEDLYPTLMGLVGLDGFGEDADGKNILGKVIFCPKNRVILSENVPEFEGAGEKLEGCIRGPYKLIRNVGTGGERLYNISSRRETRVDNARGGRITGRMGVIISGFFKEGGENKAASSGRLNELRSLGYMQ